MTFKTSYFQSTLLTALLILASCLFTSGLKAQDISSDSVKDKKNAILASYGNVIFQSQVSFAYERTFFHSNQFKTKAQLQYGHYLTNNFDFDDDAKMYDNYIGLKAVQLIGLLEMGAGLARTSYTLNRIIVAPSTEPPLQKSGFEPVANIGMRWENEAYLIRFGVGNLDLLYVGFGVVF